jgi:hypothetical protein
MIVAGCTVFVFASAAVAQGAFDFDDIPGVNQEPAIVVDINPAVMGIIRGAMRSVDPQAADMLGGLRSIKLRVYHNGDNARQFNNFIDNVTEELRDLGWHAVVSAQEEGSKVRWYMQMTGEEISGMTVMAADATEAIFINLDGTISAEDLGLALAAVGAGDVLRSFGMPPIAPGPAARANSE